LDSSRVSALSARQCEAEERNASPGENPYIAAHRATSTAAVLAATAFIEAIVSESLADIADRYNLFASGLPESSFIALGELWRRTNYGRPFGTLEKYQITLAIASRQTFDNGSNPYQDADYLIQFRNELTHYRPRTTALDEPARLEKMLAHRIGSNPLMRGRGGPWFPDHALSANCSAWAVQSSINIVNEWLDRMGIDRYYIAYLENDHKSFVELSTLVLR
jgi:hypothetical protein